MAGAPDRVCKTWTARRGAGAPRSGGGRGWGPRPGLQDTDGPAWGRGPHAREEVGGWGPRPGLKTQDTA